MAELEPNADLSRVSTQRAAYNFGLAHCWAANRHYFLPLLCVRAEVDVVKQSANSGR